MVRLVILCVLGLVLSHTVSATDPGNSTQIPLAALSESTDDAVVVESYTIRPDTCFPQATPFAFTERRVTTVEASPVICWNRPLTVNVHLTRKEKGNAPYGDKLAFRQLVLVTEKFPLLC